MLHFRTVRAHISTSHKSDFLMRGQVVKTMKCPKCGIPLQKGDIENIHLRGKIEKHYAYMCKKCDYIIGFSAVAH